jgi:tetraacyldisaccharide 4'-kinase
MSKYLKELFEKIRRNEPIPPHIAALLSLGVPLIRLGMMARLARRAVRVDARVISFGNITAGGTGKTPAVIERARAEVAAGHKVGILTRGYGTSSHGDCVIATGGSPWGGLYASVGDEPALILRKVPEATVFKCTDRVLAAKIAVDKGIGVLILDDGYQHVRLARDENHLLIDAINPFGNGRVIPRGILREPLTAIKRATHITLTRCNHAPNLDALLSRLRDLAPGVPVRMTRHAPRDLWRVLDGHAMPLGELRGMRVRAVCGIGHPEAFFRTLESVGAIVAERAAFPDHHGIPAHAFASPLLTVTTEKDAMRLNDPAQHIYALPVRLEDYAPDDGARA